MFSCCEGANRGGSKNIKKEEQETKKYIAILDIPPLRNIVNEKVELVKEFLYATDGVDNTIDKNNFLDNHHAVAYALKHSLKNEEIFKLILPFIHRDIRKDFDEVGESGKKKSIIFRQHFIKNVIRTFNLNIIQFYIENMMIFIYITCSFKTLLYKGYVHENTDEKTKEESYIIDVDKTGVINESMLATFKFFLKIYFQRFKRTSNPEKCVHTLLRSRRTHNHIFVKIILEEYSLCDSGKKYDICDELANSISLISSVVNNIDVSIDSAYEYLKYSYGKSYNINSEEIVRKFIYPNLTGASIEIAPRLSSLGMSSEIILNRVFDCLRNEKSKKESIEFLTGLNVYKKAERVVDILNYLAKNNKTNFLDFFRIGSLVNIINKQQVEDKDSEILITIYLRVFFSGKDTEVEKSWKETLTKQNGFGRLSHLLQPFFETIEQLLLSHLLPQLTNICLCYF
jgi:hypothetical protein